MGPRAVWDPGRCLMRCTVRRRPQRSSYSSSLGAQGKTSSTHGAFLRRPRVNICCSPGQGGGHTTVRGSEPAAGARNAWNRPIRRKTNSTVTDNATLALAIKRPHPHGHHRSHQSLVLTPTQTPDRTTSQSLRGHAGTLVEPCARSPVVPSFHAR